MTSLPLWSIYKVIPSSLVNALMQRLSYIGNNPVCPSSSLPFCCIRFLVNSIPNLPFPSRFSNYLLLCRGVHPFPFPFPKRLLSSTASLLIIPLIHVSFHLLYFSECYRSNLNLSRWFGPSLDTLQGPLAFQLLQLHLWLGLPPSHPLYSLSICWIPPSIFSSHPATGHVSSVHSILPLSSSVFLSCSRILALSRSYAISC